MTFKINDYLTLKKEHGETLIYLGGKKFNQCKSLFMVTSIEAASRFDSIDSLILNSPHIDHSSINPQTKFWAHCSNLQAWAENNYDTKLLDSSLSFPLLKELQRLGDKVAQKIFKEEIGKRLMSGEISVAIFLMNEGYLDFLTQNELDSVFGSPNFKLFNNIFDIYKDNYNISFDLYCDVLDLYKKYSEYFFPSLKQKLHHIFKTRSVEDLIIVKTSQLWTSLLNDDFYEMLNDGLLENILITLTQSNFDELNEFINNDFAGSIFPENIDALVEDIIRLHVLKIFRKKEINIIIILLKLRLYFYLNEKDLRKIIVTHFDLLFKVISIIENENNEKFYEIINDFLDYFHKFNIIDKK
ncbi:hypothetical protein LCGC14_1194620 [marine sediment metagenome]|uniref:Uncharacterized protein n=1 Tax=marine sediment metagenome TaxID=412755 RepID=A0A0F9LN64_9ZZZZ